MCFNVCQCVSMCVNVCQYVSMCVNVFRYVSICFNVFQYISMYMFQRVSLAGGSAPRRVVALVYVLVRGVGRGKQRIDERAQAEERGGEWVGRQQHCSNSKPRHKVESSRRTLSLELQKMR